MAGKDWIEYQCSSGETLFVYNKETGEHKWPHVLGEGIEYRIIHGRPVEYKEFSTIATQTDDNGCNNGCMSMYINKNPSHVSIASDGTPSQTHQHVSNKEHSVNKPGLANVIKLEQEQDVMPSMCISTDTSQVADVSDIAPCQQQPSSVNKLNNLLFQAGSDCYDDVVHFYDYFGQSGNEKDENCNNDTSHEAILPQQELDFQNEVSNLNSQNLFKNTINHRDVQELQKDTDGPHHNKKLYRISTILNNFPKICPSTDKEGESFSSVIAPTSLTSLEYRRSDDGNHNDHSATSLTDTNGQDPNQNLCRMSTILNNFPKISPKTDEQGEGSSSAMATANQLPSVDQGHDPKLHRISTILKNLPKISPKTGEGPSSVKLPGANQLNSVENRRSASGDNSETTDDQVNNQKMENISEILRALPEIRPSTQPAHSNAGVAQTVNAPNQSGVKRISPNQSGVKRISTNQSGVKRISTNQSGVKRISCPHCEVTFTYMSELRKHAVLHTGLKPYQCSFCEKKFSFKCNWKIHERVHSNEKPYECTYCKVKFKQVSGLNKHYGTVHIGENPFQCTICNKNFNKKSHLRVHVKTHANEKKFECHVCKKTFTCNNFLVSHLKIH